MVKEKFSGIIDWLRSRNIKNNSSGGDINQGTTSNCKENGSFLSNETDIIMILSLDGRIEAQNNPFLQLDQHTKNEDASIQEIVHAKDRKKVNHHLTNIVAGNSNREQFITRLHDKSNERFLGTLLPIKVEENEIIGLFFTIEKSEITTLQSKQTDEQKISLIHIYDELNVGVWVKESLDGPIKYASKPLFELLQTDEKTLYNNSDFGSNLVHPNYRNKRIETYKRLRTEKYVELHYPVVLDYGRVKWIHERIAKYTDANESYVFGVVHDISTDIELRQKYKQLKEQDGLTSLPNYRGLNKEIDKLITNEEILTFALLYIDLENYHWIHDNLGGHVSDMVIKNVANRIKAMTKDKGYLARINDSGFVVIYENYHSKNAIYTISEALIKTLREKLEIDKYELYLSTSIGLSFYPENGSDEYAMLRSANTALQQAKQLGKNNYEPLSMKRDINMCKKIVLERDIQKAIDNDELEVYYQPQVDPKNDKIVGAEALLRWNHQDWGLITPGEFIPLAEKTNYIHEIEDWVFKKVCEQLQLWQRKNIKPCPISVNMSAVRLMRRGTLNFIQEQLRKYDIPGNLINIEITENTLLENSLVVRETLDGFRQLGMQIALDDFGTGYSTFHYLSNFDIDILKVDRSFITELTEESNRNESIILSMLFLARELKMKIVGEGVEQFYQLNFLKQKDFDSVQGYIYSKPLKEPDFLKKLKNSFIRPNKRDDSEEYIHKRKYYRFQFPNYLLANMTVTKINEQQINTDPTYILIENISIGGLKFLSSLKLPVHPNMKLTFNLQLMNEDFELMGTVVNSTEERHSIYGYGVAFDITEGSKDRLSNIINQMTILRRTNNQLPDTHLISEDPYAFLRKGMK